MVKNGQVKMKMLAKVLKNASIILFWVAAALFGIFLLVNFVLIFIPGKDLILPANLSGSFSGSLNGISIFRINPQTNGNIMIKPVLQALFLWLTVGTAMVAVILFEVKRILKTVCEDNPFEKEQFQKFDGNRLRPDCRFIDRQYFRIKIRFGSN